MTGARTRYNDEAADAAADLAAARHLIHHGVPVFLIRPAMTGKDWDPTGGTDQCGYWLPGKWQRSAADLGVLDRWRPGDGLGAVMGHGVDLVDVDPRNGGDVSRSSLRAAGIWPRSYGTASTPSGGTHDFVRSLGVHSLDGVRPGLDVKAGLGDLDLGCGFAFLAPTVRVSKTTGELVAYRWTAAPDLDALDDADDSGAELAEMIRAHRSTNSNPDDADPFADPGHRFELPECIGRGGRDVILHRYACSLQGRRVPQVEAMASMRYVAFPRVEQPTGDVYTLSRALAKVTEAYRQYGDDYAAGITASPHAGKRRMMLTAAADIQPRRVKWAWEGRLALGTLGLLAGREGLGKSTLGLWIAARMTRGELPGEYLGEPRAVFICATEDSWEHTLVPRLIAAGADLALVFRVEVVDAKEIHLGLSLPRDLHQLETTATQNRAGMIILDPLTSRLGDDLDSHKDAEVRRALEPLVAVADRTGMSVLGLMHHNKSGSTDPLQLVMASKAFTAVARSVHSVIPDPDDDTRRRFGTPKNNLGRSDLPTLTFSIEAFAVATDEGTAWTGKVVWGDDVAETIAETMARTADTAEERSATTEAATWLEQYLETEGGRASSADIKAAGRKADHGPDALKRARRKLGLIIENVGFPSTSYWCSPPETTS